MKKRYRNPPPEPPEAVLLDHQVVRMAPGRQWSAEPAMPVLRVVLCKRGKLHLSRDGEPQMRTLCGEWAGIGSSLSASGWTRAPGTWCSTGVVRCQHCEKSLARLMGETVPRRK